MTRAYWTLTDADWEERDELKLLKKFGVPDGI